MHRILVVRSEFKKWARPNNHLDSRICPVCSLPAHGKDRDGRDLAELHLAYHQQTNELVEQFQAVIGWVETRFGITFSSGEAEYASWNGANENAIEVVEGRIVE